MVDNMKLHSDMREIKHLKSELNHYAIIDIILILVILFLFGVVIYL